jgi:hypothetical protein
VVVETHFFAVTPLVPMLMILLYRPKKKWVDDIVPIHRIDRETQD